MEAIKVLDKHFIPYISEEKLQESIKNLGQKINADYQGKQPLFLGVLNGSFMFFSDLLKSINLSCTVSFVKMTSYQGTSTTGMVNELIGLEEDIQDRDIIVVEDIVDTGNTLEKIHTILSDKKAKSIKIVALLFKPEAYKKKYPIDYVGIKIPNTFVLGYGLDYNGLGRNLNSIFVLKE